MVLKSQCVFEAKMY